MPAVNFPRDAEGRIITDPTVPELTTPSDTPSVSTARPLRAIDPRTHVAPDRPSAPMTSTPANRLHLALAAVAALLLVAALVALMGRIAPDAPVRPLSVPTAVATLVPTATPFGAALDVALVAYFDPERPNTATALDHGTQIQPIARIAHEWLQLRLVSGTAVWVRWRDLPAPSAALDALPDLTPPTPVPTELPTVAPVFAPPPPPPQPTADTRPEACVRTDAGQLCRRGLDAHDATVAAQIAATSAAYNAPFQAAYDATATAVTRH